MPLASPDSDVVLSAAFKRRLRDMRTVGTKALAADSRAERADVYASLLVSCAAFRAFLEWLRRERFI